MDDSLEARVGAALLARGWTLGAAESCTGGLLLSRLTDVPGSSRYVLGGIVAYSNAVKQAQLGVSEHSLSAHGAVSEVVAREMAAGLRERLGVTLTVSITGIAGPDGGTPEKPVGLTYIGLAGPGAASDVRRFVWTGDRVGNKVSSTTAALQWLLEIAQG
jgi:PncC family amidohydrolase